MLETMRYRSAFIAGAIVLVATCLLALHPQVANAADAGEAPDIAAATISASGGAAADSADVQNASEVGIAANSTSLKSGKTQAGSGASGKPGKGAIASLRSTRGGKIVLKAAKSKNADGYQYQVARSKSMKMKMKSKTTSARTGVFKGLSTNVVYYARVRAYRLVNGSKVWGAWSKQKSVKVKKLKIGVVNVHPSTSGGAGGWLKRNGCNVVGISSKKVNPANFDGLVIPGGGDVDPRMYGARRHPHTYGTSLKRDRLQKAVILKFAHANKPVLGICRGNQIVNVAFGGTLFQHIPGWHKSGRRVNIKKGTWLYSMFGKSESVTHAHHQCVLRLGKGLVATEWDARDGRIEAIEHETLPVYGLQWHPEGMGGRGSRVAHSFMRICLKYSKR